MSKVSLLILSLLISFTATPIPAQKLKADEVIARHLDSIGSAENRAALKDATLAGVLRYNVLRAGGNGGDGKVVISSEASKILIGISLNIPSYPGERIVFDGKRLKVDYTTSNVRSYLGDFIYRYPETINRALLGGTLTSAWVFYDPTFRKSRIESDGIKKIDGKEVHALSVLPKGGSDVELQLFFDKQTFRHVRTVYKKTISASQGGSVDTSSQKRGQRQMMVEDFGDFRLELGLTLPHSYRIYVLSDGETETREYEWVMRFSQFFFNQTLDPSTFNAN